MKIVKVILSREALDVYNNLKSSSLKNDITLLRSIDSKVSLLKENPQLGNPISKKMIPIEYIEKYKINNLYRLELSLFWRMLYTLRYGEESMEVIVFLISIINHKKYNKVFKYK
jgi:hypothetical protein